MVNIYEECCTQFKEVDSKDTKDLVLAFMDPAIYLER